ncbi:hypothetical protein D3C86_2038320 [compost metagenome]
MACRALETCLRVNQELARNDNFLAQLQSLADLHHAIARRPRLDVSSLEFSTRLCHHDHAARAGTNHRLGRHQQQLRARRSRELQ